MDAAHAEHQWTSFLTLVAAEDARVVLQSWCSRCGGIQSIEGVRAPKFIARIALILELLLE